MADEKVYNYEVILVYKGQETYYIQATSEEEAERLAKLKFEDGITGESTADYENIENIATRNLDTDLCDKCGEEFTYKDIDGGRCLSCGHMILPVEPKGETNG